MDINAELERFRLFYKHLERQVDARIKRVNKYVSDDWEILKDNNFYDEINRLNDIDDEVICIEDFLNAKYNDYQSFDHDLFMIAAEVMKEEFTEMIELGEYHCGLLQSVRFTPTIKGYVNALQDSRAEEEQLYKKAKRQKINFDDLGDKYRKEQNILHDKIEAAVKTELEKIYSNMPIVPYETSDDEEDENVDPSDAV